MTATGGNGSRGRVRFTRSVGARGRRIFVGACWCNPVLIRHTGFATIVA
jgi:hypothetical protein